MPFESNKSRGDSCRTVNSAHEIGQSDSVELAVVEFGIEAARGKKL